MDIQNWCFYAVVGAVGACAIAAVCWLFFTEYERSAFVDRVLSRKPTETQLWVTLVSYVDPVDYYEVRDSPELRVMFPGQLPVVIASGYTEVKQLGARFAKAGFTIQDAPSYIFLD